MEKVNLAEKFALITEHWRPKVVGELNGQEVKLVNSEASFHGIVTKRKTKCFWR